jgi:hypothetical protein
MELCAESLNQSGDGGPRGVLVRIAKWTNLTW